MAIKFVKKTLTLAEILIATIFLVVVLIGILMGYAECIILNESNRNLTIASTHAQYVMETLKNEYFLISIKNKINNWDPNTLIGNELAGLDNESISICCYDSATSSCFGTCPSQDIMRVLVKVNWKDRGVRDREINLETLFVEP
ncbi:MAG: hypothetical protein KBB01_00365 [Candidatus Omnitrophica bacterium]|nr:hypothetical protein [Candidatus Omnitrophota bacterium]